MAIGDVEHPSGQGAAPTTSVCADLTEIAAVRRDSPDTPIVAVVPHSLPDRAVLARLAGADLVVPVADPAAPTADEQQAVQAAASAAVLLAGRDQRLRETARTAGHDLAGTLSAINLAAELAEAASAEQPRVNGLAAQISGLARAAAADAWQAARPDRAKGLALEPTTAADLVAEAVESAAVRIDDYSSGAQVLADPGRLCAAVAELIANAGPAGADQVVVCLSTDPAAGELTITVRDNGNGVDADLPGPPVRPFVSGHPGNHEGLGLSTVAECAEDHGGRFELTSPAAGNGGATATLTLPLLPPAWGSAAKPLPGKAFGADIEVANAQTTILEGIARRAPLGETLDAIVTAIEKLLPGSLCSVLLLQPDGQRLRHGSGPRLPQRYREAIDGVVIGLNRGSCGTAAYTRMPVTAVDIATDVHWPDYRDLALEHDLRACWSTPILTPDAGSVLGTFAVYHRESWRPDDAAIQLVDRFTYLAAVAISHQQLFEALVESESRFRGAFEGATTGMALIALDGTLLKVNPALSRMLATEPADLRGRRLIDTIEPGDRERIAADLAGLLAGGGAPASSECSEVAVRTGGDEPLWVSMTSSLITGESGEPRNFYVEVQDITARRRNALEQQARQAAEAANRAKSSFLALVSHELRTPLNAVLGFAQVMQLVDLEPEERRSSVEHILRAGEHLLRLINDLLDLSQIEAGQLALAIEPVPATEVVAEALEMIGPLATSRDIVVRAHQDPAGEPPVDPVLLADRQRVRQVLINLLGNAVKYTPSGGEVAVEVTASAAGLGRIRVSDSGPGISDAGLAQLFEPFRRLGGTNPQPEGNGLGLSLAARLVQEMRGRIGVQSEVGVGSTFWVDLPTVGADPAEPAAAAPEPPGP